MENVYAKRGPGGGQLYEARAQVDARAGGPFGGVHRVLGRCLDRTLAMQEATAARQGHVLTPPTITFADYDRYYVYTITAEGFPKEGA